MSNQILPLGTIVQVQSRKLMIVGYTWDEKDERMVFRYTALPYPLGITQNGGIFTLSEDAFEVVSMGFRDESYETLSNFYTTVRDLAREIPVDEFKQYLREAARINNERSLI